MGPNPQPDGKRSRFLRNEANNTKRTIIMAKDQFGNYVPDLDSAGVTLHFAGSGGGGGGGSGTTQVFDAGAGSPAGAIEAEGPAVAFNDNGGFWTKKDDGNTDSSGWNELIAPS